MATFFATAVEFRAWLDKHAATEPELFVGFYKKATGIQSMTWSEAVDEALCHGWIDGVRKGLDSQSYQNRFTPRRPGSNWSAINIEKVRQLQAQGRMTAAGLKAFAHRLEHKSKIYSYEQIKRAELPPEAQARFRRHKRAWKFFQAQPPGYRHQMTWRVISAKRPKTREKRLAGLIAASDSHIRLR